MQAPTGTRIYKFPHVHTSTLLVATRASTYSYYKYLYLHVDTRTYTYTYIHLHKRIDIYTYLHLNLNTRNYTYRYIQVPTRLCADTNKQTNTHTHKQTHANTHMHAHIHARTHSHKKKLIFKIWWPSKRFRFFVSTDCTVLSSVSKRIFSIVGWLLLSRYPYHLMRILILPFCHQKSQNQTP